MQAIESGTWWERANAAPWRNASASSFGHDKVAVTIGLQEILRKSCLSMEYLLLESGLLQTWDRNDSVKPYKCLPEDDPYLRLIIRANEIHNKVVIPKSRDMIVTLTTCLYHLGKLMFQDGSEVVCISDKADKAEHNLGRMYFAYSSLPPEVKAMIPMRAWKGNSGDPRILRFMPRGPLWPGGRPFVGSRAEAIAQGPDKIQEFHPSHILIDQCETIRQFKETLGAILPLVTRRMHLCAVGTPHPGYYADLVHDRLDDAVGLEAA